MKNTLILFALFFSFMFYAQNTPFGNNPETGKTIHFGDHDTYYEVYGKGEPLIMIHGNGGNINAFYQQIDFFAQFYQVIALDTRGQGKSTDFTKDPYTYDLFADDLKKFTDTLNLKNVNILGWSDGGIIGLIYNMKNPKNVNRLVISGANIEPDGVLDQLNEDLKRDIQLKKAENNPDNFNDIRLMELMIDEPHINPKKLRRIKNPVLVIVGDRDLIKPAHTELIANSIPNSELKIFEDASHSVLQEKPEEFNEVVYQFLAK